MRGAKMVTEADCLRVLVAEDNADGAETLARLLRLHGHETRVALDGPAALREAQDGEPDVVLLDLGLPGLDGYEVARRLRERHLGRPRGKLPLLIAVTGYADEEARRRSADAGIVLHLVKPVDFDQLQAILLRFRRVALPN
jgi:two-component system OmpR family response regulator